MPKQPLNLHRVSSRAVSVKTPNLEESRDDKKAGSWSRTKMHLDEILKCFTGRILFFGQKWDHINIPISKLLKISNEQSLSLLKKSLFHRSPLKVRLEEQSTFRTYLNSEIFQTMRKIFIFRNDNVWIQNMWNNLKRALFAQSVTKDPRWNVQSGQFLRQYLSPSISPRVFPSIFHGSGRLDRSLDSPPPLHLHHDDVCLQTF